MHALCLDAQDRVPSRKSQYDRGWNARDPHCGLSRARQTVTSRPRRHAPAAALAASPSSART
jgi:hypothetical protein